MSAPGSAATRWIDGVRVRIRGDSDSATAVVVVGRNDAQRRSSILIGLTEALAASGVAVYTFESRPLQTSLQLDEDLRRLAGRLPAGWSGWLAPGRRGVRRLARWIAVLRYPGRWVSFLRWVFQSPASNAAALRRFIRAIPATSIHLVGHSAGAVTATLASTEPAVRRVLCFGYPFKHPNKGEEPYRTVHLVHLVKPTLIVQGNADPYGTEADLGRYDLAPVVQVVAIDTDHDYDHIDEAGFAAILDASARFLDLPLSAKSLAAAPDPARQGHRC